MLKITIYTRNKLEYSYEKYIYLCNCLGP